MKYCPSCNAPNDDATAFCVTCGAPLGQPAAPPPQAYAPPPPPQPGYPPQQPGYPAGPPPATPPGNGLGIGGLICGILALILCWFYMVNIAALILAAVGLVLSIMGRKKNAEVGAPAGVGTAGLILSIIGLVFSVIFFFVCTVCICRAANAINDAWNASWSLW